jgi:hypothetical protein
MAKNTIYLDVVVDDNGTTRRVAVDTNRLADAMSRASTGSAEADRNIKGVAQASSNATKNFSKMSQGMGGLVAAYATIAAQVFALSAAYQFLLQAADFRILIEGQKALTEQTGIGYTSITKSIQAATDAQLGYKQAAQAAAIGTAAGLSATMLKDIASYSQTISAVLGRDLEDTFNRLIRGITKAEPELLDELGIVLRLADATSEYARSINKTASDLTAYERTQGVAIFTLEQAEKKYGALRDSSELSANGIRQLGAAFSELGNKILPEVSKVAEFLAGSVKNNVAAVVSAFGLLLGGVIKQALPDMETITERIDAKIEKYANKIADYTLEADAFARGQLTITRTVKPAVNNIQGLASAIKKVQGAKAPPIIEDLLRLTAGDKFDPGQVTAMIKQIDDDLIAMAKHQARNPAFKGLTKEQLEETKAGLEEMQTAAQKATEGMQGQFRRLGNNIGQAAAEGKLAWATAMQGLQELTLGAVRVMNRIIKVIGIIGLVITIAEVIKTTALYLIDRFGKEDLVKKSLAEQIIGDGEEIELLKEQIKDVERAAKGLENIKTIGTFLDVASFEASMGGNIPDSMDKFIKQATAADSVFEQLQSNIDQAEKRLKGLERPSTLLIPISEAGIPPSAIDSYNALQNEIGRTSKELERVQKVQDATRDNQLTLIEAYAHGIPELRKYVETIQNLKQATEVSSEQIVAATKPIVDYAKAAKSVAISLQAYSEGFRTLEKQLIDSINLSPLQKRLVQISDLVKNLSDAFAQWNGSTSTDLFKTQATFKVFTAILVKLKDQFRRTFELQEQEQNIARLRNSIALFTAENFQPLSLLQELDETELNLQINKLKTELQTIQLDKDLFDLIKGKNPVINAAIASDKAAAALRAAGVENANTFKTEFSSVTNTFIEQLREENDYLIKNLAAINDSESKVTKRSLPQDFNDLVTQRITFDPKSVETLRTQALAIAPERLKVFINEAIDGFKEIASTDFYSLDQISEFSSKLQRTVSDLALADVSKAAREAAISMDEAVKISMDQAEALKQQQIAQLELLGPLKVISDNEKRILQDTLARNKAQESALNIQNEIDSFQQSTAKKLEAQVRLSKELTNLEIQDYSATVAVNKLQENRLTNLINQKNITDDQRKVYEDELRGLTAANNEREKALRLEIIRNAVQRKEAQRQAALGLLKEQTDTALNLLNVQQELSNLSNPYIQEELRERLEIEKSTTSLLALEKEIEYTSKAQLPALKDKIIAEKARLTVLQEQEKEINKISQAVKGAFGQGIEQEIAAFLKGGQIDIETSFLNIVKSVGEAAADQMAKTATNFILDGLGLGEESEAEKINSAMKEAANYAESVIGPAMSNAGNSTADAIKAALSEVDTRITQSLKNSVGEGGTTASNTIKTAMEEAARYTANLIKEAYAQIQPKMPMEEQKEEVKLPVAPQAVKVSGIKQVSGIESVSNSTVVPSSNQSVAPLSVKVTGIEELEACIVRALSTGAVEVERAIGRAFQNANLSIKPPALPTPNDNPLIQEVQVTAQRLPVPDKSSTTSVGMTIANGAKKIGTDIRNFGNQVQETFASDAPFLDKLGSIFSADAPWINSMTRGLAGALGGLAVGALSSGGGNGWRNAIIGGAISGLSFGFSSWLGGLGNTPQTPGGTLSYDSFPNTVRAANGGIMPGGFRAFANGGVVNKPTLGLVGEGRYNEAVVPLPDGKSIPVIMQTGGGDRNNIGININVNSNGQMQGDVQATGERGVAMAQAIQNVVQLELKRQKRPGGLLSPF